MVPLISLTPPPTEVVQIDAHECYTSAGYWLQQSPNFQPSIHPEKTVESMLWLVHIHHLIYMTAGACRYDSYNNCSQHPVDQQMTASACRYDSPGATTAPSIQGISRERTSACTLRVIRAIMHKRTVIGANLCIQAQS
jgi:hypothetical protein